METIEKFKPYDLIYMLGFSTTIMIIVARYVPFYKNRYNDFQRWIKMNNELKCKKRDTSAHDYITLFPLSRILFSCS